MKCGTHEASLLSREIEALFFDLVSSHVQIVRFVDLSSFLFSPSSIPLSIQQPPTCPEAAAKA